MSDSATRFFLAAFFMAKNMNYVTGANGFVGKHLVKTVSDVFAIPHDLIDVTKILPFNTFYFLSSYGNLWGQNDINEIVKANLLDIHHCIKEASKVSFTSFVYMSSSSVTLEYQTPYSRMKRAAEEMLLSYMEIGKLPICIIRPFSITGVGEQKHHLIPTLIRAAYSGESIDFVPNASHDFIDVSDVVSAIHNLVKHNAKGIFEVGNGKKIPNHEVKSIVEKVTKKKIKVNPVESLRPYDTNDWFSVNYKARTWGWMPKKTLEQSIIEMVKDYEAKR